MTRESGAELGRADEPVALLLALVRMLDRATGDAVDGHAGAVTVTQFRALRILRAEPRTITGLAQALGSHHSST